MSEQNEKRYLSLMKAASKKINHLQTELEALKRAQTCPDEGRNEPIAIIGMACRFPGGADSPEAFWQLLRDGQDAIREVPKERWDVDAYYDPDPAAPGKMSSRFGGFIDQTDLFDAHFFQISPREAASLDPQQRLLLEVSWEALENAAQLPPSAETGVFVGISDQDYLHLLLQQGESEIDSYLCLGNAHSAASGRYQSRFPLAEAGGANNLDH